MSNQRFRANLGKFPKTSEPRGGQYPVQQRLLGKAAHPHCVFDGHAAAGTTDQLPAFFRTRFKSEPGSIDGVLCWDVFDYLEKDAATALAAALTRLLGADGALLGFFSTATDPGRAHYTKYMVVDQGNLRYRTYPGTRVRQRSLQNRDIIKMFETLRVSDSFLMKTNMRELIFRKPAYLAGL